MPLAPLPSNPPSPRTTRVGRLHAARRHRRRRWASCLGAALALGTLATAVTTTSVGDTPTLQAASRQILGGAPVVQPSPSRSAATATPDDTPAAGDLPADAAPARTIPGLVVPAAAASQARKAPSVAVGITTTPEIRARLAQERAAAAATARAVHGADPGFSRPVEGTHRTSGFGQRWGRAHQGADFAGPVGQMVRAAAAGTVTFAGEQSGYGNLVEVQHADGSFTRYAHLNSVHAHVGDQVQRAQRVGTLGNSGRSTGPHLHFEVRTPAGTPINPLPWLREHGITPAESQS